MREWRDFFDQRTREDARAGRGGGYTCAATLTYSRDNTGLPYHHTSPICSRRRTYTRQPSHRDPTCQAPSTTSPSCVDHIRLGQPTLLCPNHSAQTRHQRPTHSDTHQGSNSMYGVCQQRATPLKWGHWHWDDWLRCRLSQGGLPSKTTIYFGSRKAEPAY